MNWYSSYFQLCFGEEAHPFDQRPPSGSQCLVDRPAAVGEGVPVKVEQLEALDAEHEAGPVEGVHQLQLHPEVLLGEVVEHPGVDEALHEGGPVLGEPEGGKPVVTYPLVVHVTVRQGRSGVGEVRGENVGEWR